MNKCIAIALITISTLLSAQQGKGSYYGKTHHGKKTASGEIFDKNKLTAASNTYKLGTMLRVTNTANNKSVIVKVNDTGSFTKKYQRIIDLSEAAFKTIANLKQGIITVIVEKIE